MGGNVIRAGLRHELFKLVPQSVDRGLDGLNRVRVDLPFFVFGEGRLDCLLQSLAFRTELVTQNGLGPLAVHRHPAPGRPSSPRMRARRECWRSSRAAVAS